MSVRGDPVQSVHRTRIVDLLAGEGGVGGWAWFDAVNALARPGGDEMRKLRKLKRLEKLQLRG